MAGNGSGSRMAMWFTEHASDGHRLAWRVRRELAHRRSAFQEIQVLDTETFGASLVLDGIMQTTVGDAFVYHEMMACVPLATHPDPRSVLIVGGGDGGAAREVLRFSQVRRVVMVEIDREVVEVARRHLPSLSPDPDDPRLEVRYADGAAFLREGAGGERFDVVLVDATDPEGDGPGRVLYTEAFHADLRRALAPGGLFVQHTGAPFLNPEVVASVSRDVAVQFPICRVYWAAIPTYPGGMFTFTLGSTGPDPLRPARRHADPEARWYTPQVHVAAFALPPFLGRLVPEPVRLAQAAALPGATDETAAAVVRRGDRGAPRS